MTGIGGYFGLDDQIDNHGEYYSNLIALNTARNALAYIIKARKISKLFIPYMLCDSVSEVCKREGCAFDYYHIDTNFLPAFKYSLKDGEYLYIVNLYGQICNERFLCLQHEYERIIVDNTHAFFQRPIEGIDTIYSCRKFFGVPDGAYLATNCVLKQVLKADNSDDRLRHLIGRVKDGASRHYDEYRKNEKVLESLPLMLMSNMTHKLLSRIDYEKVRITRRDNYEYLEFRLNKKNRLRTKVLDGPFAYPFFCDNGMQLKTYLSQKGIYVPTLWPNVLEYENYFEKSLAENVLVLPCDQRYGHHDMEYIVECIESV